jgi:hypothetical protein
MELVKAKNMVEKFPGQNPKLDPYISPLPKNHGIMNESLGGRYIRRGKFQYGGRIC